MMRPALVRRCEVWVPTIWGWLALLLIGAATVVLVVRSLHPFLAPNRPVGARLLVVEGWMNAEGLDQAVAAFRLGGYERVVTTGGPVDQWPGYHGHATFAERAADYLKQHGLADVTAVPGPESAQDRTYLSAVMVREWARRTGLALDALDVFSSGTHARRSRLLYRLAFGTNVNVGVYAARSSDYNADAWWRTSTGARDVLDQAIGLLWTKYFFRPPPAGSHEERRAVPPARVGNNTGTRLRNVVSGPTGRCSTSAGVPKSPPPEAHVAPLSNPGMNCGTSAHSAYSACTTVAWSGPVTALLIRPPSSRQCRAQGKCGRFTRA